MQWNYGDNISISNMARLVSYKVKDESNYSTFEVGNDAEEGSKSDDRGILKFCYECCWRKCKIGSNDSVHKEDDIEFAVVKYTKVSILKESS